MLKHQKAGIKTGKVVYIITFTPKSSFALVSYTSSVAQFYLSNPHCCAARVETAKSIVSSQVCAKQKSLSIIFSKYLFCRIYLQLLTVNMRKSSITTCIFRKVYRSGTSIIFSPREGGLRHEFSPYDETRLSTRLTAILPTRTGLEGRLCLLPATCYTAFAVVPHLKRNSK